MLLGVFVVVIVVAFLGVCFSPCVICSRPYELVLVVGSVVITIMIMVVDWIKPIEQVTQCVLDGAAE